MDEGAVEGPATIVEKAEEKDEESDEEEVLIEPRFKYEQIEEADVIRMFSKESATAAVAYDKFIVIGTSLGNIWIMDHMGHVDKDGAPVYRAHRVAVSRLSIDSTGKYVMSAANDGKVVIKGVFCDELDHTLAVPEIARSIALTPEFAKPNSGNVFVIGERNLTIYTKGFFGYSEKVVFRGVERDGFITRCSCNGPFIAFTNEQGTRIYDRSVERILSIVAPKHDVDRLRSNRHPPQHKWLDKFTLAIGWADTLMVVQIRTDDEGGVRHRRVVIIHSWRLELLVSGVSFTVRDGKWHEIVLLGLKTDSEGGTYGDFCETASIDSSPSAASTAEPGPILQLLVLEPNGLEDFVLQAEDRITLPLKARTTAAQIQLASLPYDGQYFLLSPTFFLTDKIRWRMANHQLEGAWVLAAREPDPETRVVVGREMIGQLLKERKLKYATSRLKEVCGENKQEWEYFVGVWERERIVTLLADVVPTTKPQLEPECYEVILQAALFNNIDLFRRLVQVWNPDIYRVGALITVTLRRLQEATLAHDECTLSPAEETSLYLALAHLYIYERKFENAIKIYLALKDKQIFSVIDKYMLFDMVKDQINELMGVDTDLALRLLLDNADAMSPAEVMTKIARQPKLQMHYLTRMFARNKGAEFADQAIRLYAEYDRKKLLPLLRRFETYSIRKALEVCKQKNFVEEMIFLLGKSGNRIEALNLMISRHNRIDMAIAFCREHEDADLWDYLVDEIVKRPQHMKLLLSTAGPSLDPLSVVQKLPAHLDVPGLRDALAKILSDYAMQVAQQRGCHDATLADVRVLMKSMVDLAESAVMVGGRSRCALCHRLILGGGGGGGDTGDIKVFACQHMVHVVCAHELERNVLERQMSAGRASIEGGDQLIECPICADDTDAVVAGD